MLLHGQEISNWYPTLLTYTKVYPLVWAYNEQYLYSKVLAGLFLRYFIVESMFDMKSNRFDTLTCQKVLASKIVFKSYFSGNSTYGAWNLSWKSNKKENWEGIKKWHSRKQECVLQWNISCFDNKRILDVSIDTDMR